MVIINGINEIKNEREGKILVEAKNISKFFGNGDLEVRAIDDIDFKIQEGDFTAVMGPSGSGKTTLLNMLGVLDKPTAGKIIIDGVDVSKVKESKLYEIRREKIGFIFQSYYLIPTLNILENVLIPVLPLKKSGNILNKLKLKEKKEDFVEKAKELLKRVGLRGKEHRRPAQISGGEQQRVAIARSLILNPPLVLADEPTGNLDTRTGMGIVELMKELNQKEKKTFLVVTHDPRITKFCNKTIRLLDGKLEGKEIRED